MDHSQLKDLDQAKPLWRIIVSQFAEHRMAVVGFFVIVSIIGIALSAPLIERVLGIDPNEQNPFNRYQAMGTTIEWSADRQERAIERFEEERPADAAFIQDWIISNQLVEVFEPEDAMYDWVAQYEVSEIREQLARLDHPAAGALITLTDQFQTFHLLGTDELGRDVFLRLIYGARVSIMVGLLSASVAAILGLIIGCIAGFYGGLIDSLLMRITDALLSIPTIPVLVVIAAADVGRLPFLNLFITGQNESIVKMVFIICLFSWMVVARLVRGSVLSIKEREFVLAARALGARDSVIIVRHLFPNVLAPVLVAVSLGVGEAIIYEASLSFLGLGIQPPLPSWGNMLFNAQELINQAPHLAILPGLLILITVISFNYVGDGLQDAVDPKAIRR